MDNSQLIEELSQAPDDEPTGFMQSFYARPRDVKAYLKIVDQVARTLGLVATATRDFYHPQPRRHYEHHVLFVYGAPRVLQTFLIFTSSHVR